MEEKERYECKYNEKLMKHYTFDNENKEELGYKGVVRVLNQQDARIKELEKENQKANIKNYLTDYYLVEKENQQLKKQLSLKMEELHIAYCGIENVKTKNGNLKEEIKQLKQSQNQKAIEVLEKVKNYFVEECEDGNGTQTGDWEVAKDSADVAEFINNQIEKLGIKA